MIRIISAIDKLFPAPKDGAPGADAVVYRIVCSNATPNVTDSAAVITLTAMKITGSKREKAALSSSLYFTDGTNRYVSNPLTVTIAKGATTSKTFLLKDSTHADPLDEVSISPVVNGQNGTSILAQYCPSKMTLNIGAKPTPDETNVHNTYMSGDEWMRTKSSADTNYGSWFRIVGENGQDGEYTDYTFNLSKDKTNKDAYTSPGNLKSTNWTDAPQTPDVSYPYVWMRMQRKNLPVGTAVLYGHEYTYVRLTGEDGKTVTAQYSVDGKTNWHSPFATGDIWMHTSEDGGKTWGSAVRIVGEKGDGGSWTDYLFNISSCLTTSSSETAPSPLGRSNWEDAPMATTTTFPYLWMMVQRYSDADTKDGNATYVRLTGEKGPQGQTGGVGPMMYYAGEWQQGVAYYRTTQVVPLVSHGDDQFFYYPAKEGSLLNSEPSSTNTSWKQQQKVPLLLAQLLMVDFGKIASAVFCGDYMISQKGRRFDTNKNDYIYDNDYKSFEPETYTESDDRDWRPLVAIDFKEGILRVVNMIAHGGQFHDVNVDGKVKANLFYGKTKDLTNVKDYTIDPVSEPANCYLYNEPAAGDYFVKLPKASDYDGLEISFFVKWTTQKQPGIPRLHIGCTEPTDHIYCRCSATQDAGSTEKRFIPTFDNLTIGYTDFIGTTVTVYWNRFVRFKSMGGSWYAIEGVFTGE